MKTYPLFTLLLVVGMTLSVAGTVSAKTITFESLLDEMVDRSTLANFPSPEYICKQASSYDRKSVSADKPDWFANGDRAQFIRKEKGNGRKEKVMMDAKGPGAIVRWWVTSHDYLGTIRVYLDGAKEPVIMAKIDDLVGGKTLVGAPLSAARARGRNLYLPIPYAKRCKVTFEGEDLPYYQINYRTYVPGTKVVSFTGSAVAESQAKIDVVQKRLLDPSKTVKKAKTRINISAESPGGNVLMFRELKGPGAIGKLTLKLDAEDPAQALRSIVLKATFDGEQTIWCPLGDFFGSGVGVNPYKDWYRQVEKDGTMTCWWIMPYEKSCVLALESLKPDQRIKVTGDVHVIPWTWTDRSMHFHANWRQERGIKTKGNGKGKPISAADWNYLNVEGKGVYVGDTLALVNRVQGWWGEGDEKIYVDGEKFPSHFGTGTEDYYGYAWCTPKFFESPFHAQPRAEGPRNFGNVTNTRVRLLDDIPFTKSYNMDMEIWHWSPTTVDYAVTTYWYGFPGAKANHAPQPEEAKQPVRYDTK